MARITLTDEQAAALSELAAELESDLEYGRVRPGDAVAFLLDRHADDEPADAPEGPETDAGDPLVAALETELESMTYQELQRLAGETDGVEPSGKQPELRGRLAEAVAASVRDRLSNGTPAGAGEETDDESESESDSDEDASDEGADADDGSLPDPSSVEPGGGSDDDGGDAGSDGDSDGGGPSRLQRMMSLLEDHEDKWREVNDDRGKYEVDLPDGGTESARTKDDVRALLMRHYR